MVFGIVAMADEIDRQYDILYKELTGLQGYEFPDLTYWRPITLDDSISGSSIGPTLRQEMKVKTSMKITINMLACILAMKCKTVLVILNQHRCRNSNPETCNQYCYSRFKIEKKGRNYQRTFVTCRGYTYTTAEHSYIDNIFHRNDRTKAWTIEEKEAFFFVPRYP